MHWAGVCCSVLIWTNFKSGPLMCRRKCSVVQEVYIATNLPDLALRNLFQNQSASNYLVWPQKLITVHCTPEVEDLKIINHFEGALLPYFLRFFFSPSTFPTKDLLSDLEEIQNLNSLFFLCCCNVHFFFGEKKVQL